ncbi:MAG: hypothetical protein OXQ89_24515 [Rhodospirillaceae bacterium]|nr:hypothetical protein [Rhodospirillaceae bacterium]MDE0000912.1 hypothetical protein [Rhodospirillaceae bacterium]MDE0360852.1 hypothetical protein [Rhodospirillaceae bacterium]
MTNRLQVLLDYDEYLALQQSAREDQMTMAEWVRQALRQARQRRRKQVGVKLRVLEEACRHEAPTADIETMLDEIEQGYQSGDFR